MQLYLWLSKFNNISSSFSSPELSLLSLASSLSSSNSSLLLSLHDSQRQRGPHANAFLRHLQFVPFAHLFFLQQHLTRRISFCVLRFRATSSSSHSMQRTPLLNSHPFPIGLSSSRLLNVLCQRKKLARKQCLVTAVSDGGKCLSVVIRGQVLSLNKFRRLQSMFFIQSTARWFKK